MNNLTPEQRIENIKTKINNLNTKKIQAQAQLNILQPQYDAEVQKLQQLGITDLSNIPAIISGLEKDLNTLLTQIESNITAIEANI